MTSELEIRADFKIKATAEKWMVTSRGHSRKNKGRPYQKPVTAYLRQQCGIQSTDIKPDG